MIIDAYLYLKLVWFGIPTGVLLVMILCSYWLWDEQIKRIEILHNGEVYTVTQINNPKPIKHYLAVTILVVIFFFVLMLGL